MDQYIEFVSNHQFLVLGTAALIAFLVYYEMDQLLGPKSINPVELTRGINDATMVVVDVRDAKAFDAGHISGAAHIPLAEISKRSNELNKHKEKTIIFSCDLGMTSRSASKVAKKQGLDNVKILAGGIDAWSKANLPLISR